MKKVFIGYREYPCDVKIRIVEWLDKVFPDEPDSESYLNSRMTVILEVIKEKK